MGAIINFLMENYIFVVFVAILLVLALIGYIVDSAKTTKLKKEFASADEEEKLDIPVANIDSNVKLGSHVNKMAMNSSTDVNSETSDSPVVTKEEPPVLGTLNK